MAEEYRLPQITMGAKEKCQPYVGDLSIIIWVRYHTHTHPNITPKHKTHARACALRYQNKQNKGCQSRKTTESRRIMVLKYFTIFSSFQEELA